MKRLLVVCAFASVAALVFVGASSAAQGTLSVTPANPVVGDSLVFTGCGWTPTTLNKSGNTNQNWVTITVAGGLGPSVSVPVDKSGCFTTEGSATYLVLFASTYQATAFQGGGGKAHQAFLSFTAS